MLPTVYITGIYYSNCHLCIHILKSNFKFHQNTMCLCLLIRENITLPGWNVSRDFTSNTRSRNSSRKLVTRSPHLVISRPRERTPRCKPLTRSRRDIASLKLTPSLLMKLRLNCWSEEQVGVECTLTEQEARLGCKCIVRIV